MFHFRNQEAKVPAPGKPHWDTHIYSYDAPSLPQAEASAMYAKLAAETLLGLEWHYSRFPVWCPTLLENVMINGNISLRMCFFRIRLRISIMLLYNIIRTFCQSKTHPAGCLRCVLSTSGRHFFNHWIPTHDKHVFGCLGWQWPFCCKDIHIEHTMA